MPWAGAKGAGDCSEDLTAHGGGAGQGREARSTLARAAPGPRKEARVSSHVMPGKKTGVWAAALNFWLPSRPTPAVPGPYLEPGSRRWCREALQDAQRSQLAAGEACSGGDDTGPSSPGVPSPALGALARPLESPTCPPKHPGRPPRNPWEPQATGNSLLESGKSVKVAAAAKLQRAGRRPEPYSGGRAPPRLSPPGAARLAGPPPVLSHGSGHEPLRRRPPPHRLISIPWGPAARRDRLLNVRRALMAEGFRNSEGPRGPTPSGVVDPRHANPCVWTLVPQTKGRCCTQRRRHTEARTPSSRPRLAFQTRGPFGGHRGFLV